MSSIRMFASSLILAASLIACAADAPTGTDSTSDPTPTDPSTPTAPPADPTPAPTPADPTGSDPTTVDPTTAASQITPAAANAVCNAGGLFCCNAVASASTPAVSALLALLGIHVDLLDESVGLSCQATATASACTRVPTCCTSSLLNLVALDCSAPNTP